MLASREAPKRPVRRFVRKERMRERECEIMVFANLDKALGRGDALCSKDGGVLPATVLVRMRVLMKVSMSGTPMCMRSCRRLCSTPRWGARCSRHLCCAAGLLSHCGSPFLGVGSGEIGPCLGCCRRACRRRSGQ